MPLPSHQWGVDVLSPQFAFLSLQRFRLCPKREQPTWPTLRDPVPTSSNAPELPCETLQTIFAFAAQPNSPDPRLEDIETVRASIAACSQVCQFWRAAARGYRALWVHSIDFQRLPLRVIIDYLHLSDPHPIPVGHRSSPFRISSVRDVSVLDTLFHYRHRIKEINLEIDPQCMRLTTYHWLFSSKMPLDTFRMTGTRAPGPDPRILVANPFQRITNGPLRKLSLQRPNFSLALSMDMSHLTELSVSDIVAANRMTAHQWIEILRKPSRLQVLSLHDAIQDGTIQVTGWSVRPPSKLQHLRLVSLGDRKSTVALRLLSIFCSTLLPSGCGVHLDFPEALAHESVTDAIASLIAPLELHFHHNLNLQASETPQVELDIGRFPWSKRWYIISLGPS
ncbi:hypothetical protein D9611_005867 [Ephemerocybe angulata]|uniref:F-box domain-containing protein n=1 Tax=Ephemerocybe angulata TaxID=980116 RepID=A0A8H5CG47_9AGAR|nr:hypothetical protein D9611_005867 [Tulosesus angulatus]